MKKVLIGIPAYHRQIDVEILYGITGLEGGYAIQLETTVCSLIHVARNRLVERFLKSNNDWLYFWDADVVIRDPKLFDKLIQTSKSLKADITGAPYRWKDGSGRLTCGNKIKDGTILNFLEKEVSEKPQIVDAIGTGSMLISRKVLEKMKAPWFYHKTTEKEDWSEDYLFCLNAKKLGFKTAIDPRIETKHWGLQYWQHLPKTE